MMISKRTRNFLKTGIPRSEKLFIFSAQSNATSHFTFTQPVLPCFKTDIVDFTSIRIHHWQQTDCHSLMCCLIPLFSYLYSSSLKRRFVQISALSQLIN